MFDQRKFTKKKGQGFLGVVTVTMGVDYNLTQGGISMGASPCACTPLLVRAPSPDLLHSRGPPSLFAATLFLTLRQGSGSSDPVSGTVNVTISSDVSSRPTDHGTATAVMGTAGSARPYVSKQRQPRFEMAAHARFALVAAASPQSCR